MPNIKHLLSVLELMLLVNKIKPIQTLHKPIFFQIQNYFNSHFIQCKHTYTVKTIKICYNMMLFLSIGNNAVCIRNEVHDNNRMQLKLAIIFGADISNRKLSRLSNKILRHKFVDSKTFQVNNRFCSTNSIGCSCCQRVRCLPKKNIKITSN